MFACLLRVVRKYADVSGLRVCVCLFVCSGALVVYEPREVALLRAVDSVRVVFCSQPFLCFVLLFLHVGASFVLFACKFLVSYLSFFCLQRQSDVGTPDDMSTG